MKQFIIYIGFIFIFLVFSYFLLRPMSSSLIRYIVWNVTSASPRMRGNIKIDGVTIHFVSYGSGSPILLLHGGLSNRLAWFSQIPELVEVNHQVIVMDVRGHGISSLGRKKLNYRLLAHDAIGVLDKLKINKTDIIGWSDGGNTALTLGKEKPSRIKKIIAISANYAPSGLTTEAVAESNRQSTGISYWLKRWWTGAGTHFHALEKRTHRMWRTCPVLQAIDLENIKIPTLVIVGQHDIISIQHAKHMAELLPYGSLNIIPGGHYTPVTNSTEVNKAINKFLLTAKPEITHARSHV